VEEINRVSEASIGAAVEVHRILGPGLLEATYEAALCIECDDRNLKYRRQHPLPLTYKHRRIGEYRLDLLVEDAIIVEIKSVSRFDPVFAAQVLTYLRASSKRVGLLINFNSPRLTDGIKRFIL
jgi:GxxExxY protein